MKERRKEKVKVYPENKMVYGERDSNDVIIVKREKVKMDSDRSMITDKYGYRYVREIKFETYFDGYYYYSKI